MTTALLVIQIVLSVALIVAVLMQTSAAGLGGALGGSDNVDSGFHTRRGLEKYLFNATIVISILFVIVSFVIFLLSK